VGSSSALILLILSPTLQDVSCYFLSSNNPWDFVLDSMPIRSGHNYLDWNELQGLPFSYHLYWI